MKDLVFFGGWIDKIDVQVIGCGLVGGNNFIEVIYVTYMLFMSKRWFFRFHFLYKTEITHIMNRSNLGVKVE